MTSGLAARNCRWNFNATTPKERCGVWSHDCILYGLLSMSPPLHLQQHRRVRRKLRTVFVYFGQSIICCCPRHCDVVPQSIVLHEACCSRMIELTGATLLSRILRRPWHQYVRAGCSGTCVHEWITAQYLHSYSVLCP